MSVSKTYSVEELASLDRLSTVAIQNISEIVTDRARRIEGYRQDQKLLNGGIWYANEYFKLLREEVQKKPLEKKSFYQERLKTFLKEGSFYHGYVYSKDFQMRKVNVSPRTPTGVLQNSYFVKDGVKSSDALKNMRKGVTFTGCGETCMLGYLEAIKEFLGVEKFDKFFSSNPQEPLIIQFAYHQPSTSLFEIKETNEPLRKGQIVYILNSKMYSKKHFNGEATGFFCICCDDTPGKETFTSLGLPIRATRESINQTLLSEFNEEPIGLDIIPEEATPFFKEEVAQSQKFKDCQITIEELKKQGGGKIVGKVDFNIQRILQLKNSSLDQAPILFNQFAAEEKEFVIKRIARIKRIAMIAIGSTTIVLGYFLAKMVQKFG
ncbi:MAG: hypothetical protein WCT85_06140 [Parachlamydiales bacterium]|jgi:hypothetical protein